MAKLAIKGHTTRSKEVIEILEMLGGKNVAACTGINTNKAYVLANYGSNDIIDYVDLDSSEYNLCLFTLEEYFEKFPYKVGDKVLLEGVVKIIKQVCWNNTENEVIYKLETNVRGFSEEYYVYPYDLRPYKEETVEDNLILNQLIEYFNNTPRDVIEKEWNECGMHNEIGPAIKEYFEHISKPKYPKTFEECHELMVQWKKYDCNPNPELILCEAPIHDFCKLIVARNIYWKIAGEQLGLGKPWEPDWSNSIEIKYCITTIEHTIEYFESRTVNIILAFPTEEIRDTFCENFKALINEVKKLL